MSYVYRGGGGYSELRLQGRGYSELRLQGEGL